MPVMDGWETLERLRDVTDAPILMLTARGLELEKVRGLRGGADDYQTKPYGNQELLARVEALLRRAEASGAAPEDEVYADARLVVDFARHHATVDGREVQLSARWSSGCSARSCATATTCCRTSSCWSWRGATRWPRRATR